VLVPDEPVEPALDDVLEVVDPVVELLEERPVPVEVDVDAEPLRPDDPERPVDDPADRPEPVEALPVDVAVRPVLDVDELEESLALASSFFGAHFSGLGSPERRLAT
jgi:hypothetical protein